MSLNSSPAAERNRSFILRVLEAHLPASGTVLEIASGTGQHAVYAAPALAPRIWQPTDCNASSITTIEGWIAAHPSPNIRQPLLLDVLEHPWPVEQSQAGPEITAIIAINMIHIAPWCCCEALFDGAQRILPPGGVLYLYGPFKRDGHHTAPSNQAFDTDLRKRDPEWGIRDLEVVTREAADRQLGLSAVIEMPANNLSVVFSRR